MPPRAPAFDRPEADAKWRKAHAEENTIRLIDAMELITQK